MICVDCGKEIEKKVERKEVKAILSNPGDVKGEGNIIKCPYCNTLYSEGNDALELMDSLEKDRIAQEGK